MYNPLPFLESRYSRIAAIAHVHWQYLWLLVFPLQLSADWSYACLQLKTSFTQIGFLPLLILYTPFICFVCQGLLGFALRPRMRWWILVYFGFVVGSLSCPYFSGSHHLSVSGLVHKSAEHSNTDFQQCHWQIFMHDVVPRSHNGCATHIRDV